MRVLLGVMDIANQMRITAKELNRNGVECRFIDGASTYLNYTDGEADQYRIPNGNKVNLDEYDIVDAYFGSFLPVAGTAALPPGLKVIHHFCGSDVRQQEIALKQNPYAVSKQGLPPDKHIEEIGRLAALSDACTIKDHELYDHVAPYFKRIWEIPRMIDLDHFQPMFLKNERPLIVHAPTHTAVKGTGHVVRAIYELMNEGYQFDFRLVSGMAHSAAMEFYRRADIVIDQLHVGTYGQLAVEAMALGKVVISYISDYMGPYLPNLPVINANPDTFKAVLKSTLDKRDTWRSIGQSGVKYVSDVHDSRKVVKQLIPVYEAL
jgi:hypothetical protein